MNIPVESLLLKLSISFVVCAHRSEWLQLWDHLFTFNHIPEIFLLSVVAYLIYHRRALLDLPTKQGVVGFLEYHNLMNMGNFLKLINKLKDKVSTEALLSLRAREVSDEKLASQVSYQGTSSCPVSSSSMVISKPVIYLERDVPLSKKFMFDFGAQFAESDLSCF